MEIGGTKPGRPRQCSHLGKLDVSRGHKKVGKPYHLARQPRRASTKAPLTIFGKTLRMDDKGRLCLTDMHKAAGGDVSQRPSKWLELPETRKFLQSLSRRESVLKSDIIGSIMGRNGGTFAHWQIALAYAKYLSPELHMAVNETYMRYNSGDHTLALEVIDKDTNTS